MRESLFLLVAVISLTGCAEYATVRVRRPLLHSAQTTISAVISIEQSLITDAKSKRRNTLESLSLYLEAASAASKELANNPKSMAARDAYNFSVARIFSEGAWAIVAHRVSDIYNALLRQEIDSGA